MQYIGRVLRPYVPKFSGVARVGVTRGGNCRAPKNFDLLKVKTFAIFSLLHWKIEFIPNISDDFFLAFYTKACNLSHKISHLLF